jgi:hypothetical protein
MKQNETDADGFDPRQPTTEHSKKDLDKCAVDRLGNGLHMAQAVGS